MSIFPAHFDLMRRACKPGATPLQRAKELGFLVKQKIGPEDIYHVVRFFASLVGEKGMRGIAANAFARVISSTDDYSRATVIAVIASIKNPEIEKAAYDAYMSSAKAAFGKVIEAMQIPFEQKLHDKPDSWDTFSVAALTKIRKMVPTNIDSSVVGLQEMQPADGEIEKVIPTKQDLDRVVVQDINETNVCAVVRSLSQFLAIDELRQSATDAFIGIVQTAGTDARAAILRFINEEKLSRVASDHEYFQSCAAAEFGRILKELQIPFSKDQKSKPETWDALADMAIAKYRTLTLLPLKDFDLRSLLRQRFIDLSESCKVGCRPAGEGFLNWWSVFNRSGEPLGGGYGLYRAYVQVNPDQIAQAVEILYRISEERKIAGLSQLDFKFLVSRVNIDSKQYKGISNPDQLYGYYEQVSPADPVIAIYCKDSASRNEIMEALCRQPEWSSIEDVRRNDPWGCGHRRAGTNAFIFGGQEYRTICFNDGAGFAEDNLDIYWRGRVQGFATDRLRPALEIDD